MTTKENSTKSDRSTGILYALFFNEKLAPKRNSRRLDSRLSNFYFRAAVRRHLLFDDRDPAVVLQDRRADSADVAATLVA
jgi:hypothetical protein